MTRIGINCCLFAWMLSLNGCVILGVAANAVPQYTKPKYTNLAGQSIAVMVWVDRGVKIDWPNLALDSTTSLQSKLTAVSPTEKLLKDATFPIKPASVVRYQMDHPEVDTYSIIEVAPKLGVSRLIYVEVDDFATRADSSVELFRGHMTGTLRIIEIAGGVAKVAFEENNISAVFPRKSPKDGLPDGNDFAIYAGTVDAFTTEVLKRLVPLEVPPGEGT